MSIYFTLHFISCHCICGLVVEFQATDSEVLGSIPGTTRFSEKWWVWNGGSLSLMSTIEELLERKSSGSALENQEYGHRDLLC
jgi:hypothetical protein